MLNEKPGNEKDVVYAFVKIRKLIELGHDKEKKAFWRLNLFCNWLLHVELRHFPVGKFIEELVEQYIEKSDRDKRHLVNTEIYDLLSLDVLRYDLLMFLKHKDLPTVWAEDSFAWNRLLKYYSEEIRNTPLTINTPRLKHLNRVVITSCEPSENIKKSNPEYEYLGLQWELTMKDGTSITLPYTSSITKEPPSWKRVGTK